MKIERFKYIPIVIVMFIFQTITTTTAGQEIITLGQNFPDFTLIDHNEDSISLSDYSGKNVFLIFPRGKFFDDWCRACHYQYAELADLEQALNISKKYNLEILFILPYSIEDVKYWTTIFSSQMEIINNWKNPNEQQQQNPRYMRFVHSVQRAFPIDFEFNDENPALLPFSVLADEDKKLSTNLGLYTTYWDNNYFEQNEPTIYIINPEGKVLFKYKSQATLDRPDAKYLLDILENTMD